MKWLKRVGVGLIDLLVIPWVGLAGPADGFVSVEGINIRYQTWGQQHRDKAISEFEELKAKLPVNTAVLVPTSGHYVQEEAPAETAAAMNAFVDRVMNRL